MRITLRFFLFFLLSFSLAAFAQTVHYVEAGPGVISAAYQAAAPGDIIELVTSGGSYTESATMEITADKAITIRAAAGITSPVWQCEASPFMTVGGTLIMEGLTLDGQEAVKRAINTTGSAGYSIKIVNSTLQGFEYMIYGSSSSALDSLVIINSLFKKATNRALYFPAGTIDPGVVKRLSIRNSTFMDMKKTEPSIYFYAKSSPTVSPRLELDHVTFYNCQRIRTNSGVTDVSIRNTIFATDGTISGGQSLNLNGGVVENTLVFNAPVSGSGASYSGFMDNVDPLFTDAANGDLTLLEATPAFHAGSDGKTLGDPRWWPRLSGRIYVAAGRDQIAAAVAAASPGDVIELTSDGGLYVESSTVVIDKPVTIQPSESIVNPPVWTSDDGGYLILTRAGLTLTGVVLDGGKGALQAAGGIATDSSGYNLILMGCDFLNFGGEGSTTGHAIYDGLYQGEVDSLVISSCYFNSIAREGIYLGGRTAAQIGTVKYFHMVNSTMAKIGDDAVYIRDHDGNFSTPGPVYLIDHCTFYDAFDSYGLLAHYIDNALIKNTIAAASTVKGTAFYLYGDNSLVKNSLYFNLKINLHTGKSENLLSVDPLFVDPESGDFMLFSNSPAIGYGDDGTTIGDPRWGVSTQKSNELQLVKGPASMSPTTTSVRIVWETLENDPPASIVEYGLTPELGTTVTGADGWLIPGEGVMHEVTLTGLQPFTTYYYRVGNGTDVSVDINKARTAPERGTPFRLMTISDIHENHYNLWQGIAKRAPQDSIDLTVFIGDFVNDGSVRDEWNGGFFNPGKPLLDNITVISSVGNHETAFGPSVYYDYFSLPTHAENGETPEAYYSMEYGDVKIIAINSNGDEYSPSYLAGSLQLTWLEEEIKNADTKWIFIFSHTNVLSTAYHGQWSATEKENLLPLYEKYAAQGKRIIAFAGDDHSFEHLYKAGVNYVRPGCANLSLYDTDLNLVDKPYSMFYSKQPGFSTVDVSDNGDLVTLAARDTAGVIFYSATFTTSSTPPPTIYLSEPDGIEDSSSDIYRLRWVDSDPDDNASINLYYTADLSSPGELIAENISEDDSLNYFDWDVSQVSPGSYYIYAVIRDTQNPPVKRFSRGKIDVIADVIAPPAVTALTGTLLSRTQLQLSWQNPTDPQHVEVPLASFETDIEGFVGENDGTATGSLELVAGPEGHGNALRINYSITVAWDQYAGVLSVPGFPNISSTPYLEFWYRGDGSSRALRLIVEQDNDRNGKNDDWWYSESLNLTSREWKHAVLDLRLFSALTWHANMDRTFDLENMARFDFIIPSSNAGSGFAEIDDIKLTGEISPAPDFQGVIVLRRSDRFPESINDGEVIYQGPAESCVDSTAMLYQSYYYAAFAYDEVPNYSQLGAASVWLYTLPTGAGEVKSDPLPDRFELKQNYPNPFNPGTTINYALPKESHVRIVIYNSLGQEMAVVVDRKMQAGYHQIDLNCTQWSGGVYFYQIQTDQFNSIRKMVLLK